MLHLNLAPFPELKTGRLLLRRPVMADVPSFFILRSDPALMRYIPRPLATVPEDVTPVIRMMEDNWSENNAISWMITLEDQPDTIIGTIGYIRIAKEHHRAEVGYLLHGDYHGKGIMQEALLAVLDFGFDTLGLHSVEAVVYPENKASRKILERNGFVQEAYFRDYQLFNDKYLDAVVYCRINPKESVVQEERQGK